MDEGKRRLLKALPMVAMAPALMLSVGEKETRGYELAPEKKYVFRFPDPHGDLTLADLVHAKAVLGQQGINATVIAGDVEIYELL